MEKYQQIAEILGENLDMYEIPKYKITEGNNVHKKSYIVYNLEVEYEDDTLFFRDDDGELLKNNSVLAGMLEELIVGITVDNGNITISLHCSDLIIELMK